jgi:hypothetical protein
LGAVPPVKLRDVTITAKNDYAAVYVVSLDGRDLATSGNVLVQAATTVRPYGFKTAPTRIETEQGTFDGQKITDLGSSPVNLDRNQIDIELRGSTINKAYVVDANGYAVEELPLARTGGAVRFSFPEDALSVVLRQQ